MSLTALGDGASYEFRWRTWALLRDVLVANLDEATLPTFCSLGDAMVDSPMHVDAAALASEIAQIRAWLVDKPFEMLVIGPRTSVLVHMTNMATTRRPLSWVEIDRIRPIGASKDLAEYFALMLDSFERVCAHPQPGGMIELIDG
jgi:hypothetical protein